MRLDRDALILYAVTDRTWLGDMTLASQVKEAVKGGATMVQLREKGLSHEMFLDEAMLIKPICREYGVPFVINDNVDLAVACGADGVHVGQEDIEAGYVRSRIGPDMFLGVSVRTPEQAVAAEKSGADYLGAGAVFSTSTKHDAKALSRETLSAVCASVNIPVVAIGGIAEGNIMELAGSGVAGVAAVSSIFAQGDIEASAKKLLRLSLEMTRMPVR